MNPEKTDAQEPEIRITALLLGELDATAAAEVRAAIDANPEWSRLHDRLRQTMDLVREAAVTDSSEAMAAQNSVRLSESRRANLANRFKVVPMDGSRGNNGFLSWGIPIAAAAGLTLALSLLNLSVDGLQRTETLATAFNDFPGPAREFAKGVVVDDSAVALRLAAQAAMERAIPQDAVMPPLPPLPHNPPPSATTPSPIAVNRQLAESKSDSGRLMLRRYGLASAPTPLQTPEISGRVNGRGRELEYGKRIAGVEVETAGGGTAGESVSALYHNRGLADGFAMATNSVNPPAQGDANQQLNFDLGGTSFDLGGGGGIGGGGGGGASALPQAPAPEYFYRSLRTQPTPVEREQSTAFGEDSRADRLERFGSHAVTEEKQESSESRSVADFAVDGLLRKEESLQRGVMVLGDRPVLGRYFMNEAESAPAEGAVVVVPEVELKMRTADGEQTDVWASSWVDLDADESSAQSVDLFESVPKLELKDSLTQTNAITAGYAMFGQADESESELSRQSLAVPEPQPEVATVEQPVSTFSLNVSDVSFRLAAASLENGVLPEPAAVRAEEFINAFNYRDPEPVGGEAIGLTWERARYPFAHGRDLIRFAVRTAAQGRALDRPLNLVLLLDTSGSMERADRVRIIQEAMRVLANQIQPQDRVSVVSFARTSRLWVDGLAGTEAAQLPALIGELSPEGGTNLEQALALAYETAERHFVEGGLNRVVLLTDGAANLGAVEPLSLQKLVESNRLKGIALDCFGIGWEGYNDDLLETISRHGDGRYGFINAPEEASTGFADQLAGALQIAAANVKVQVEFNPARVTAYRQIGYAKHQLTEEQFRDNSVDAAEIGAAESGNALYVAQVEPQGEGPIGVVRARYQDPATREYHEREWVLPYMGPAPALEASSASLRLAGVASAFAEWLARSPFAGEVTHGRLLQLLEGVPETFEPDPLPQQLRRMIFQGNSLAGGSLN